MAVGRAAARPVRPSTRSSRSSTPYQPPSGFASLRIVAVDAAGNKVDQQVHRAYAVR
jgi:hypothetical protein